MYNILFHSFSSNPFQIIVFFSKIVYADNAVHGRLWWYGAPNVAGESNRLILCPIRNFIFRSASGKCRRKPFIRHGYLMTLLFLMITWCYFFLSFLWSSTGYIGQRLCPQSTAATKTKAHDTKTSTGSSSHSVTVALLRRRRALVVDSHVENTSSTLTIAATFVSLIYFQQICNIIFVLSSFWHIFITPFEARRLICDCIAWINLNMRGRVCECERMCEWYLMTVLFNLGYITRLRITEKMKPNPSWC